MYQPFQNLTYDSTIAGKDALELAKTIGKVSDNPQRGLYPRFGDEILPHNARKQIIEGNFRNMPILIGNNKNEGSTMITKANKKIFGFFGRKADGVNRTVGERIMRKSFRGFEGVDSVVEHYLGSLGADADEKKVLDQVLNMQIFMKRHIIFLRKIRYLRKDINQS